MLNTDNLKQFLDNNIPKPTAPSHHQLYDLKLYKHTQTRYYFVTGDYEGLTLSCIVTLEEGDGSDAMKIATEHFTEYYKATEGFKYSNVEATLINPQATVLLQGV